MHTHVDSLHVGPHVVFFFLLHLLIMELNAAVCLTGILCSVCGVIYRSVYYQ